MSNRLMAGTHKMVMHTALTTVLALVMALMATMPALAVVAPQPTYGTAVVDGSYAEWNLTDDFFAYMYRAGNPSKPG
jgi:hypothetical protein